MNSKIYICERHDRILEDARAIVKACQMALLDPEHLFTYEDLEEVRDLADAIILQSQAAKIDGQRMEDRLIERSVQHGILEDIGHGLTELADVLRTKMDSIPE